MRRAQALPAWLAAALAAAALVGCLLELPATCGDGRVDLATESCDPAAPGPNNGERCDPLTCRLLSELGCGNGKLDPGEQCDTGDFGPNKTCPSGKGFLSCTDDCKLDERTCDPCGNGRVDVDAGEECDPRAGQLAQPKPCSELTSYPVKPYTSGHTTQCTDRCLWYRGPCGYCGDGEVDDPQLVDVHYPEAKSRFERCDGDDLRLTDLREQCDDHCPAPNLHCEPRCNATCQGFEEVDGDTDLRCCHPAGDDCPTAGATIPCCAGFAPGVSDPFDALATCELRFKSDEQGQPVQKNVCR